MGSIDSVGDTKTDEWVTEMKPYTFRWELDLFGKNKREVSVILPTDTKFRLEMIPAFGKNEWSYLREGFVDGSSGILVPPPGEVRLAFYPKIQKGHEILISRLMASVSFSWLPKNISQKEFLNQLKKKDVQVLSESNNSLLTAPKSTRVYQETIEKTLISGNVVVQIKVTNCDRSLDALIYRLLHEIRLTPQMEMRPSIYPYNPFSKASA